jgi:hypothetical protein
MLKYFQYRIHSGFNPIVYQELNLAPVPEQGALLSSFGLKTGIFRGGGAVKCRDDRREVQNVY